MGFDEDERDKGDHISRRIKDGVNVAFISVLGWVAITVQTSTKEIAVLQNVVENLRAEMTEAKGNMANRYTSTDADKDLRIRDAELTQIEARLVLIENNVQSNRQEITHMRDTSDNKRAK